MGAGQLRVVLSAMVAAAFSADAFATFLQLERSLEQVRRAEAAKNEFLSTMSHELRTPLNGVLGLVDAARATAEDRHQRHLLDTAMSSGDALLHILNDLLDLSKIEAGRLSIEESRFAPADLVIGTVEGWSAAAEKKGLTLGLTMDRLSPLVVGDPFRIRQILNNLLSNAIKFTQTGAIHVTAAEDEAAGLFSIRVTDEGIGIAEPTRATIFDAFSQADMSITRRFGGTGLGLTICKRVAHAMGGDVTLERTGTDGSTFRLTLPITRAAPELTEPQRGPVPREEGPEPAAFRGQTALVVEDNAVNRLVAEQFLGRLGFSVVHAEDGVACLDLLAEDDAFDVILMDNHMPRLGGIETIAAIRALPSHRAAVPIVAVTADAVTGAEEDLRGAGANAFLTKPLSADRMRRALLEVMARDEGAEAPVSAAS